MTVEFDNVRVQIANPVLYTKIQKMIIRLTGVKVPTGRPTKRRWSDEDTDTVIRMKNEGKDVSAIAEAVGRTESSVKIYIDRIAGRFGAQVKRGHEKLNETLQEFVL